MMVYTLGLVLHRAHSLPRLQSQPNQEPAGHELGDDDRWPTV